MAAAVQGPPPDHGHTSYSVGIVAAYFGSQLGLLRRCQAVSTAAGSGLNLKVDLTLNGCSKKFTAAAREDASESEGMEHHTSQYH